MRLATHAAHVVVTDRDKVTCLACGNAYRWALPAPLGLFVAGCTAYADEHLTCAAWRDEWRTRLLRVLVQRVDTRAAMELQRTKEEGSS